ncbi:hypothetical protein BCR33DRAFT_14795 [Rhizoclosmatium globosum]|uniref:Uncharacterized protein n=1 Tax=Rhizoclosmatium globosum TaxID=329046 RepID=A0A1Y2CPI8_9FUNG|nr:hypothetical protein BCR33DRAFT_14795 [Rhizoclosmatium globosum]|eukprot:ORY48948.1 hypothetical protein BCR33DRAFT_14795 [Rhizoclosmatium globosum]
MLLAHVVFYVLELSLTSMLRVYTVVGVHHILGIMIAGGLVLDPNGICFIVGIPFFLHTLYWALDGQFFFLLIFYNFSMLLGASYGFITTEGLDFAARPVKYATVICVSCISLFFNNYFMYCHGLMGEYCLTVDPLRLFGVTGGDELDVVVNNLGVKSNQGPYRGALFWAMLWYICWMAVLIVWASRMKEVWRKNPPSFAVTQPYHQLDTDCEAALIEDKQI